MNRFRTKKKAKEISDANVRPSTDSEAPTLSTLKPSKTFRMGKKSIEPEPIPQLDLSTALPSSDDFRTSLLMSGLSARFSMLREQDDPKTKIGKASDDSVLFPKRKSRLDADFGFQSHGLADIAEVSSINGSIQPPFAAASRADSFKSSIEGYGTDYDSEQTGSIMNRAKPGEGNILFGGRQKVQMGNRTLYENDVSQSSYQKLRKEEREKAQRQLEAENPDTPNVRSDSPPPAGYNHYRETSSTTSSNAPSIGRVSTAATSFTSQSPSFASPTPNTANAPAPGGLERSVTKTRRLYENGLNDHLHEQQFSAMNRIDTLTRQRTLGAHTPPPGLSPTFAPASQSDRWGTSVLTKQSMPNLRGASPPTTGTSLGTFDYGVKTQINNLESKSFGMTAPPLSPPVSEHDEIPFLADSVQPNDKGKATAMGTFTKPTQPYDDSKYSQRQIQMQQGRETPPMRKNSPPQAFHPQQQQTNRNRAESNSTYGSGRSRSSSSVQRIQVPERIVEKSREDHGTFLFSSSPNDSSNESLEDSELSNLRPKPLDLSSVCSPESNIRVERPPESEHPMNRSKQIDQNGLRSLNPSISSSTLQHSPAKSGPPADSPTIKPLNSATGLSGMVRQHLRSDSNSSSIYGGTSSMSYDTRFPLDPYEGLPGLPAHDYSTKSNPWDNSEWDDSYYSGNLDQNEAGNVKNGISDVSPSLSVQSPGIYAAIHSPKHSWDKDIEASLSHTRDGSTATQKEQQDFKNELATRRRQVKENLKSFHENESPSAILLPIPDLPKEGLSLKNNALGLLKKPSRGSLMVRTNTLGQSKAMKMLGLGSSTISSGPPSPGMKTTTFVEENSWKAEEEEMVNGVQKPITPPGTRAFRQARREMQRDKERQLALKHQQKLEKDAGESEWPTSRVENQHRGQQMNERDPPSRPRRRTPSRDRKPPPVTYKQRNPHGSQESKYSLPTDRSDSRPSSRDRSESDTSGGRSKSRNGRYRDDLAKAMAEGLSSSSQLGSVDLEVPTTRFLPRSPSTPHLHQSPMPSPRMSPADRSRSNSRSAAATYFDSQKIPNLQTSLAIEAGMSPRPSPSAPFVVNPTPPLTQNSAPGSGANTPTSFQSTRRKISVNKSDISEPVFMSSTSRIDTINLPPGASLKNGIYAPPIPPVNPRRLQTRGMFGIGKKSDSSDELSSLPAATQSSEEMSTFSADEDEGKPKSFKKLRKSSSEGGNLNARARQAAYGQPSPAMPGAFPGSGSPPQAGSEGMMF